MDLWKQFFNGLDKKVKILLFLYFRNHEMSIAFRDITRDTKFSYDTVRGYYKELLDAGLIEEIEKPTVGKKRFKVKVTEMGEMFLSLINDAFVIYRNGIEKNINTAETNIVSGEAAGGV